jgi:Arc/MetJ family transcription regulator
MRTTVDLDEQKLIGAAKATGITQKTALLEAGLDALIAREAARRLAKLGGRDPKARAPRRRRAA